MKYQQQIIRVHKSEHTHKTLEKKQTKKTKRVKHIRV